MLLGCFWFCLGCLIWNLAAEGLVNARFLFVGCWFSGFFVAAVFISLVLGVWGLVEGGWLGHV